MCVESGQTNRSTTRLRRSNQHDNNTTQPAHPTICREPMTEGEQHIDCRSEGSNFRSIAQAHISRFVRQGERVGDVPVRITTTRPRLVTQRNVDDRLTSQCARDQHTDCSSEGGRFCSISPPQSNNKQTAMTTDDDVHALPGQNTSMMKRTSIRKEQKTNQTPPIPNTSKGTQMAHRSSRHGGSGTGQCSIIWLREHVLPKAGLQQKHCKQLNAHS